MKFSRRDFGSLLAATSSIVCIDSQAPWFWRAAAASDNLERDTVLVVIQLTGGNDGLNTVVPYRDDAYRKLRPKIGIPSAEVLTINDELGFHSAARGFAELLESGRLAIVQGVGYAQPNRSHFESMDFWHTCQPKGGSRTEGWLGRSFEAGQSASAQVDLAGMYLGEGKLPLALVGRQSQAISIASPDVFRLHDSSDQRLARLLSASTSSGDTDGDDLLGFLQASTTSALSASEKVVESIKEYAASVAYPTSKLAQKLKTAAQLIVAGLKTRVYYLELDGFDTHSQQPAAHSALLSELSLAMKSFLDDLRQQGHGDRVLMFCFSEFGRRVAENASEGTDHGAAAPVFLAGEKVKPGLHGQLPSLSNLEDGDLRFHTDFRQVYAAVLQNWMGWNSTDILGGAYEPINAVG